MICSYPAVECVSVEKTCGGSNDIFTSYCASFGAAAVKRKSEVGSVYWFCVCFQDTSLGP